MQQDLTLIDYYLPSVAFLSIAGGISFFVLPRFDKKIRINQLLAAALMLVFFYEFLAFILAFKKIFNSWVYLIFFSHGATWLNLMIIREFIFKKSLKRIILGLMYALLLLSGIPYLMGIIPFNDGGEYTTLLGASFIIFSCGLFFFELLSNDNYLSINPLEFSGFWICTLMLFFYSASFMIFISYTYLINNYLDLYNVVIELTRSSALLLYFMFFLTLAKWKRLKSFSLQDIP